MPCLVERRDIYAADGSGKGQPEAVEFPFGLRSFAAYISIYIYLSLCIGAA